MATLTSKTSGVNIAVSLNYKWDSYFNSGDWFGAQTESNNPSFANIIWYNENSFLTKIKPNALSAEFQICAVTIQSYNVIGLGTTFKLFAGTSEVINNSVILLDIVNKIYLVREGTTLFIVKKLKDYDFNTSYTSITRTSDTWTFKNIDTSATKVMTFSITNRNNLQTSVTIKKVDSTAESLILSLPADPDNLDFTVQTDSLVFTDFA